MLTKKEFQQFRQEADEVLSQLAEKYDINIKAGNISYNKSSFNLKIEATKKEVNGKSFEQAEFEKYCLIYDLQPEDYNREFVYAGKKYNITGFKPRSRKYPVLVKCDDGKTYKFTKEMVKQVLNN